MNRNQRLAARKNQTVVSLNESARALDKALHNAGVPERDKEPFLKWAIGSMWNTFKEQRMDQRLMTEYEVRQLGIRFPNGIVKKDYETYFNLPIDKIYNVNLIGAQDLGLNFTIEKDGKCSLIGKPKEAGDFIIKLQYNTVEGEPVSELAIPIAFNPNPRDLWQSIPTDTNIIYYKSDGEAQYIKVSDGPDGLQKKDLIAASLRGRSHAREGSPRDDHFSLYHSDKSDWYVIAVADGAGSAKYSRRGSEVACETVVEHCQNMLYNNKAFESAICEFGAERHNRLKRTNVTRHVIDIVYKGAIKAHDVVKKVALADGARLKDYATTLMFAICKKYDFGWFIASFWVGDGAMCLFDAKNKTAKLLGTPDEGEFSGQTRFLTMPEIFRDPEVVAKRLRMAIATDFTALFLMTDGISDPMFETEKNLNDYAKWEEFYNRLQNGFPEDEISGVNLSDKDEESKDQLLNWLNFWSPGNHDDRTIAILH